MAEQQDLRLKIEAINAATTALSQVQAQLSSLKGRTDDFNKSQDKVSAGQKALQNALGQVSQSMRSQASQIGAFSGAMDAAAASGSSLVVASAGVAAGMVAIGVAAFSASKFIGDYAESVTNAALRTGLTVQEIGGLRVAAANVGRSFESVETGVSIFVRKLDEARNGSEEAVRAFQRLGISSGDLNRSVGENLEAVGEALAKIEDPAKRSAVAFALLGRQGGALIPVLMQNLDAAEELAIEYGVTLSPAMQKVADDADKAHDRLKIATDGLRNIIAVTLAPLGTMIANMGTDFVAGLRDMTSGIQTFTSKLIPGLDKLERWVRLASIFRPSLPGFGFLADKGRPGADVVVGPGGEIPDAVPGGRTVPPSFDSEEAFKRMAGFGETGPEFGYKYSSNRTREQMVALTEGTFGPLEESLDLLAETSLDLGNGFKMVDGEIVKTSTQFDKFSQTVMKTSAAAISGAVSDVILGFNNLGDAVKNLTTTILDVVIRAGVSALLGGIGFQHGGVVMSGVYGKDTVPAMLGRGEAVIGHEFTAKLDRFLTSVERGGGSDRRSAPSVSISVDARGGFLDRQALDDLVSERIIPSLNRALSTGSHR